MIHELIIDIDDQAAVRRLLSLAHQCAPAAVSASDITSFRSRLLDLLPKPRPEEPTGFGAVVRAGGEPYRQDIRHVLGGFWWKRRDGGPLCDWADLPGDIEILFPGVEVSE